MRYLRYIALGVISGLHLEAGALAQERRVNFTLGARALYDSNIARSSEELARVRGLTQEEFRVSPAVGAEVQLPLGRHLLSFEASVGADIHKNNKRLDRERIDSRLGLNSNWGRCTTSIEGTYARRQSDLIDVLSGPIDNTESLLNAVIGARCPRGAGLVPSATVSFSSTENSRPARFTADSRVLRAEGRLAYVSPSLGELGLFVRQSTIDYPRRPISPGSPIDDQVRVLETGIRYTREVGSLLQGTVAISYADVDRRLSADAFSGETFLVALRFRPQSRLNANVTAERRVDPTNRVGISYALDDGIRGEINYALTNGVLVSVGSQVREREFKAVQFGPEPELTLEETNAVFGSVRVQVGRRMLLVADAIREKRETNVPLYDFTSTRFALAARLSF